VTRVKICGITSAEDAAAAVDAGADALGLVFVPGTPRYVPPDAAADILAAVPPLVATVGVFVNHPLEEVLGIVSTLGLHAVQLHGQEPAAYSRRMSVPVIRALRVRDAESLQPLETYPAQAFLLDAYVEGIPGGTGTPIALDLALLARGRRPVILSGGLRPDTVSRAVRLVRPYGVDVSSGVEASPGRKDHRKVREFIVNVRQADLG
jgi:phosphoribosylanthranilate isomerase